MRSPARFRLLPAARLAALSALLPLAAQAAGPALNACDQCMVTANESRKACIQTRGPEDKASCDKAMVDAIKRCEVSVCKKPAAPATGK